MLVLSRKLGQGVNLSVGGLVIELSVVRIAGNRVQIGLAAPSSVSILRSELQPAIATDLGSQPICERVFESRPIGRSHWG